MKLKHKTRLRKGFSLVELLVVIAIIAGLAAISFGPITKKIKEGKRITAVSNARNIYVALVSYASKNDGLFPSENTARDSEDGTSAEGCFTMLINSGDMEDEELFWNVESNVIGTTAAAKPDLNKVVDPGENAFGYISGLSTSSRSNVPIIFDSSATAGQFDTAVWDGLAIIVKANGSAEAVRIDYGEGAPTNDDGSSKKGPITEKRGSSKVDIFSESARPNGSEILVPSS